MKVTREEIVKLAMKAHINGQYYLADNLRDVAAIMDDDNVREIRGKIDFRKIDRIEKSILLTLEETSV